MTDTTRFDGLHAELRRLGAEAAVVLSHEAGSADLAPFVGSARLGEAFVVVPAGGPPRLGYWTPMEREEAAATGLGLLTPESLELPRLSREAREPDALLAALLRAALTACEVAPGRLAIAGGWPAGTLIGAAQRLTASGWTLVSAGEALLRWRKPKGAAELAEIRRVAEITNAAFRAVASRLAATDVRDGELFSHGDRLTVGRLKSEVRTIFAAAGLTEPRENIIAPGEEGGVPHTTGTPDRVLRAGESLVVDLFPKGLLYADCTRTFCVGEAQEPLRRAHADVLAALELAHRELPGTRRGWDLQRQVCGLLAGRGWPTPIDSPGSERGYVHNLGHGVGYELHELPSFRDSAGTEEGAVEPGDVVTLEPGLYEPGAGGFGVRLEDLVVVNEHDATNLTPLPYDLDPAAW